MNDHESRLQPFGSDSDSGCVECLGLGAKRLPLGALAADRAETLDAQFLSGGLHRSEPALHTLQAGLARCVRLPLVLHQLALLQAADGLLLKSLEVRTDYRNFDKKAPLKIWPAKCGPTSHIPASVPALLPWKTTNFALLPLAIFDTSFFLIDYDILSVGIPKS